MKKLTRQEFETLIEAMNVVKSIGENSPSFLERRAARAILPGPGYHVGLIDKLQSFTESEK